MRTVNHLLLILLVLAVTAPAALAQQGSPQETAQDITIVRTDEEARSLTGAEIALRLSQQTDGATEGPSRVVLASASSFADALAASVVQADGPMLLVEDEEELSPYLHAELVRLDPDEVLLLGGTAVISDEIEEQVRALGLRTVRLAGPTRLETATAVAGYVARDAEVAIVVRAFDAQGGNGSAAWADSVSVGAMAASAGWPVLLTESGGLSRTTQQHLRDSNVRTVFIVGGVGAVSKDVERTLLADGHRVERIAGADRLQTALAVARARGTDTGSRMVLVPDTGDLGWQSGLAAARHAGMTGGAIVPVGATGVSEELRTHLARTPPAALTCLVARSVCEGAREASGMPSLPLVTYSPAPGAVLSPEEHLVVGVDDPGRRLDGEGSVSSDCTVGSFSYLPEGAASFTLGAPVSPYEVDRGSGAVPVQPEPDDASPSGPQAQPGAGPGEPIPDDETPPGSAQQTTCTVTTTFQRVDGGTIVDETVFHVVELYPAFRVSTHRQVEDSPVVFQDRSSGLIDTWAWTFGDGRASAEREPTHTYRDRGCMDVGMTVTSVLAHWSSGRLFQERTSRVVAVDPSDDDTHVELLVVDAATGGRQVGEVVTATGPGGTRAATTGADGRAVFTDLADGRWTMTIDGFQEDAIVQDVVDGRTLCPVMLLGPVGDLRVSVLDATGAPLRDARIEVLRDGTRVASDTAGADGSVLFEDLPVASYTVRAADAGGMPVGETSVAVADGVVTEAQIQEPPPPPPATPTPAP